MLALRQPRTGEWLATVSLGPLQDPDSWRNEWGHVPHIDVDVSKGFATTSTTHVHLLEAGAGLQGWKGCTSLSYLRDGDVLAWADSTHVRDVNGSGGWNVEAMEEAAPGWISVSPAHDLEERSWPLVPLSEYLEPTPLGRAEWMVPLAWMVGDSLTGAQAFGEVELAYAQVQRRTPPSGKRVFTGSVADGIWHAPGSNSFVAQWIRDAGGDYALAAEDPNQNVELGLESLLELASNADAWVVVTSDPDTFSVADLLALDPRHKALLEATGEVWVCNTAKADYFGGVVPHPEWVLDDLKSLMDGKESGPHGLFARLKTNPEGR